LNENHSVLSTHDNFNDLLEDAGDVTMEMTGNMASPTGRRQHEWNPPPSSPRGSWDTNAKMNQYNEEGGMETMELTGTIRSGGISTTPSHNNVPFSPFRNAPSNNRFSPANNWPPSHSTPQKMFSNKTGTFNRTSSPSPWGTSKRQSQSVSISRYHNEASIDDSLGSDFADRMDSFHKRGSNNILDEEIPALDDSFTAGDIPVAESMSLDEFLTYAGISFMDNITASTNVPNLASFDKENAPPPTLADYIVTHSSTIPELELYQYCCKELTGLIEDGKVSIKETEDQIENDQPTFISDYLSDDLDMRDLLDIRFKLIKQHARLSGKQEWYIWRENLIAEINQVLKRNLKILEEQQAKVDQNLMKVNKKLPSLISFLIDMRQTYIKATERAASLHTVDLEQLADLETEIEEQKSSLDTFKKDAEALEEEEAALNNQLEQLLLRKRQLNEDIEKANEICNEYKCLTLDDLRAAKKHYKECVDICRWEPIKMSSNLLSFIYDRDLEIRIDLQKLKLRKSDATAARLVPSESNILV
jgi:hypothetical protein